MSLYDLDEELDEVPHRLFHWLGRLSKYGVPSCFSCGPEWIPRSDIYETEKAYHVFVDLAWIEPSQIELSIESNVLRLQGERKRPRVSDCARVHQIEIDSGKFRRNFQFPVPLDTQGVQSSYRNGFLEVVLPKLQQPISVQVPLNQE